MTYDPNLPPSSSRDRLRDPLPGSPRSGNTGWMIGLLILALVVLVLFGRGRISEMMGDFGKGIKSFKAGMSEETDRPASPPPAQIAAPVTTPPSQPAPHQPATLNGDTVIDSGNPPKS